MRYYLSQNPEIDNRLSNYPDLFNIINERVFNVKDSLLGYREIKNLSDDKVISDNRDANRNGWRKFSFKELVFLNILKKLKDFGLTNKQLLNFKSLFLDSENFERTVALCFTGSNLVVTFDSRKEFRIFEWEFFSLLTKYESNFLVFNLASIVDELKKKEKSINLFKLFLNISEYEDHLTDKEKELISILTNKNYKKIEIKKDDEGKVKNVYAKQYHQVNSSNEKEMFDIIKSKKWAKFDITKNDNGITSFHDTDIFKY